MCPVSCVGCPVSLFLVELVSGGSVINGALPRVVFQILCENHTMWRRFETQIRV